MPSGEKTPPPLTERAVQSLTTQQLLWLTELQFNNLFSSLPIEDVYNLIGAAGAIEMLELMDPDTIQGIPLAWWNWLLYAQVQYIPNDTLNGGLTTAQIQAFNQSIVEQLTANQMDYIVDQLVTQHIVALSETQIDQLTSTQKEWVVPNLESTHIQALSETQLGFLSSTQLDNYIVPDLQMGQIQLLSFAQLDMLSLAQINYVKTL